MHHIYKIYIIYLISNPYNNLLKEVLISLCTTDEKTKAQRLSDWHLVKATENSDPSVSKPHYLSTVPHGLPQY